MRGHVDIGRQNKLVICIDRRSNFPFSDETKLGVPSWKVLDKVISFRARHRSNLIALQRRHEVNWVEEGFNDSIDGRTDVRAH